MKERDKIKLALEYYNNRHNHIIINSLNKNQWDNNDTFYGFSLSAEDELILKLLVSCAGYSKENILTYIDKDVSKTKSQLFGAVKDICCE